jgi:hypothetical protein
MDSEERHQFNRLAKVVEEMARELTSLLQERDREQNVQVMDGLRQLVAEFYSHTTNYSNLIIAAGYAGAFAVWQFMGQAVTANVRLWSALLLLTSLILFVGHQVQGMLREGWRMRHLSDALLQLPAARRLEAAQALFLRNRLQDGRIWIFVIIPTVACGLAGGLLLLISFIAKLFGYQFLP